MKHLPRRSHRVVLAAVSSALALAGAALVVPTIAQAAASTLGAAAAQSGRYFGTAIAANRL
ncbi:1,4-beta-xylanase, partial [Micromonospora sp. CMU55-4]|nr:1,4-beta-xylanase [Micromonospora sp. CMU55-4]